MQQAFRWITFTALWILVWGQAEDSFNPEVQNYEYHYFVRDEDTGDIKSHEERKIGDSVKGQYSVGEPNGDLRVVKYTADEGGFIANVKYEEGGSPLSEKEGRESNSKTGFEFQWLPANPDDITAAAKEDSGENADSVKDSAEDTSSEESGEKTPGPSTSTEASTELETSSIQQDLISIGQDMPGFDLGTTSLGEGTSEPSSESEENSSEKNVINEIQGDAGLPPAIIPDMPSSESKSSSEEDGKMPTLDLDGIAMDSKEEAQPESNEKESSAEEKQSTEIEVVIPVDIKPEKESESDETKETEPEAKQPEGESESKSEESKEESAEAAASSPETAATEPSQMYLPILPFQNPFLNFPMQMGSPQIESNSPTIIYASQNFYNPWQWLGSRRGDEPSVQDNSNSADSSQYLSSLGYLIMPPRP